MTQHFDLLIDTYLENNIGIDPLFLPVALCEGLQENILTLQREGKMIPAQVGNAVHKDPHQNMRSDKIYWMDKAHGNSFENEFLLIAENFVKHLNMTCYTGINDFEFHYALYEAGSFYKRHKDQFKNDSNRKYSLISYLNDGWTDEDGGQLCIYQQEVAQTVLPHSQTTVFFKSDEMEHEVTKANRNRMSITGWLKQV